MILLRIYSLANEVFFFSSFEKWIKTNEWKILYRKKICTLDGFFPRLLMEILNKLIKNNIFPPDFVGVQINIV